MYFEIGRPLWYGLYGGALLFGGWGLWADLSLWQWFLTFLPMVVLIIFFDTPERQPASVSCDCPRCPGNKGVADPDRPDDGI